MLLFLLGKSGSPTRCKNYRQTRYFIETPIINKARVKEAKKINKTDTIFCIDELISFAFLEPYSN